MQLTPTEIKLAKARTQIVLAHPFIGSIALNMNFRLDENIPARAMTNGKECVFKPSAIDTWTDEECQFVVAHECFHPMLMHNFRLNNRNPSKWNRAGDYVINELLTLEQVGKMPANVLQNSAIYAAGNGSTDGIYAILPDEEDDSEGDNGGMGGDIQYGQGSPAELEEQAQEMQVLAAQAAQAARMQGALSAHMERFVKDLLNPKVPWADVLNRFMVRNKTDQRTFARPSRRFISSGLYLPTISGESMGEIAVAVDCSGSISEEDINQFAAEITKIKDDLRPTKIHVIYFDTQVSHMDTYLPEDELDIRPHGGGGTDFAPIFEHMLEHDIEPAAFVCLTDLCCGSFGYEPDCPVLWVSNHSDQAPFGEVVMM